MKALVLLLLLALLTLSLCRRGMGHFRGVPGCGEGTYAVSWGEQRGSGRGFLSFGVGGAVQGQGSGAWILLLAFWGSG